MFFTCFLLFLFAYLVCLVYDSLIVRVETLLGKIAPDAAHGVVR